MKTLFTLILICFITIAHSQICEPNLNSLYFNGTSSYIEYNTDNYLNIIEDLTVEAWVNAKSWGSSYVSNSIVCKHGWTSGERGYVLRAGANGQLSFSIAGVNQGGNNVSWKEVVSSAGALQLNTWHHVAGTYNGDKIRLYIDGVQVASVNFKGTIDEAVDYKIKIGRIADNNTGDKRYWHGFIDEVRIWDDALSENEIDSRRNAHLDPSSEPNLIGYWRLNDSTGNSILDLGSGANAGIRINTTTNTDVPFTNGIFRPDIIQTGNDLTSSSLIGNQWNYNGVPIPGANGVQYTPQQSGIYSVTSDYGAGCIATSLNFIVQSATLVEELLQSKIKYYLSDGIIYFDAAPPVFSETSVQLSDLNGRRLFESNVLPEQINLLSLSKGIYVLTFQSTDKIFSRKIALN